MADAQVPPQSIEDEEVVLAEILDHEIAYNAVANAGLAPGDFYSDRHRFIFAAMQRVAGDGHHPDFRATWSALGHLGLALPPDAPNGAEGVREHQLVELVGRSQNPLRVAAAAERLVEYAQLRRKIAGAQLILEGAYIEAESARAERIDQGLELIVSAATASKEPTGKKEIAEAYMKYLKDPEPEDLFALPFAELNDCILGGLRRREVSVFAAWSEHGKSWLVDQFLDGFAGAGHRCAVFATEMDWVLRSTRFVTTQTGISMEKLLRKEATAAEVERAEEAVKRLPYDHFPAAGWNENKICERIVLGGYDVAVIDVVNYIPEYVEKVAYAERICQRFLATCQRANCHIMLVAHFNKERDKQKTKPRPVKRDLKQTSALEQIASTIVFLHRDETVAEGDSEVVTIEPGAELFFAKTRTGMGGSMRVYHNSRFLTFQPEARRDPAEEQVDRDLPGFLGVTP
jgi:replicative DNA helicase